MLSAVAPRTLDGATAYHQADVALAGQIPVRCTNRKNSLTLEMSDEEVTTLTRTLSSSHPLISLSLVRDREAIRRIAELSGRAAAGRERRARREGSG